MRNCSLIVAGEMNIDIVITNLPHFPRSGDLVNGDRLFIGPGGKSRNIAVMAGILMPEDAVAMISKTVQDKYGLWEEPVKDLQHAGVNTEFIHVVAGDTTSTLPGFAVILVDLHGNNQIIGAPGINREFSSEDIDRADRLFDEVAYNKGSLAITGCCPITVLEYIVEKARDKGIKVLFDPGGADDLKSLIPLLRKGIYVFKPNEHETEMITDIVVNDFDSARQAAEKLMEMGTQNVLITAGAAGAYLFTAAVQRHIPVPKVQSSDVRDETGCGDQAMATLCAYLQAGKSIEESAELAILSGTMQFHKQGIQPVSEVELQKAAQP